MTGGPSRSELGEGRPRATDDAEISNMKTILRLSVGLLGVTALLAGCASSGVKNPSGVPVTEMRADERGFIAGTGIESQDIVTVADKMAREMLSVPEIANAKTVPRIVCLPVKNDTAFPINKDIFLEEIMANLNEKAAGKLRFLARDRMTDLEAERNLKRTGAVTSSTDPNLQQFKGADYMLTGNLMGTTTTTSAGRSDYVLYSFKLIDPNTSEILWQGSHRIKKQGQSDAVYR
jgi:penicillin-binding protein activator